MKTCLPQIKSNHSNVVKFVNGAIRRVVRVVNFRMHPVALVVGIINLLWLPFSLKQKE